MDERSKVRTVADLLVRAETGGSTTQVYVHNLSSAGCLIETTTIAITADEVIRLRFMEDISVDGHLVWQQGRLAGVRFSSELHQAVVEHLGFRVPAANEDLFILKDRFGRPLPGMDGGSGRARRV